MFIVHIRSTYKYFLQNTIKKVQFKEVTKGVINDVTGQYKY